MSTGEDEYHESGEFLDLFSHDAWQALREPVRAALAGADPGAGPVVDLGAGSGRGTRVLADALPAAHIMAVEPSAIQRAALFARIDGLHERITVVAADAERVVLPDRLGAVIAMNMIGHLRPEPAGNSGTKSEPGSPRERRWCSTSSHPPNRWRSRRPSW